MRTLVGPIVVMCILCSSANAGGLEIGAAEVAFNPCDATLPSREDYLKTVVGTDGNAVYDMQVKYHSWLCDGAGPALLNAPAVIAGGAPATIGRLTQYVPGPGDEEKLVFVFPGSGGGRTPTPSSVPLPASGLLLLTSALGLGLLRRLKSS